MENASGDLKAMSKEDDSGLLYSEFECKYAKVRNKVATMCNSKGEMQKRTETRLPRDWRQDSTDSANETGGVIFAVSCRCSYASDKSSLIV